MAELKFSSRFRSEEMVVPRNLNDFTSSTTSPAIVSGTRGGFFFLKSNTISFVLDRFNSKSFSEHRPANLSISPRYADSTSPC